MPETTSDKKRKQTSRGGATPPGAPAGTPPGTPREVWERAKLGIDGQRRPVTDPTLGVAVQRSTRGEPRHRLVAIGDSLTHGFQSGAVFNTDLSYPAIIAHELGWAGYTYPTYGKDDVAGGGDQLGGYPLNVEVVLRRLEDKFGPKLNPLEGAVAVPMLRHYLDEVEDYWERGPGRTTSTHGYLHDLAVYGWNLRDALTTHHASCAGLIADRPKDDLLNQFVESSTQRAAARVYPDHTEESRHQTVFQAAATMGEDHDDDTEAGIETLIVMLGANNALQAVTELRLTWTDDAYGTSQEMARLTQKITGPDGRERLSPGYTVSRPDDFRREFAQVVAEVKKINARHVIFATVPHVTIAPIARGIPGKVSPGSRYFTRYVRPWIRDEKDFKVGRDACLSAQEARLTDSAIDFFNDTITEAVCAARSDPDDPRDWRVFEMYGLLEGLATRRYSEGGMVRPTWLPAYVLPPALTALADDQAGVPVPDTRFLTGGEHGGRSTGGLFGLDGVHPTTVAYGLIAQELITVMAGAGVQFDDQHGRPRTGPVEVDFDRLVGLDTLVRHPPRNVTSLLTWARHVDHAADRVERLLGLKGQLGSVTQVAAPGPRRQP